MEKKTISDYTEAEFLEFVRKICRAEGETEADDDKLVDEFERLTEHPYKNGLIYYPLDGQEDSP
ncbi:bacteriocin immunity protein, partial [Salmonella enterica subsp. enterica]|nr:bacteriocin immunity protein [Salmonella enterica subsp. enterica]